jgi:hypothetical protein
VTCEYNTLNVLPSFIAHAALRYVIDNMFGNTNIPLPIDHCLSYVISVCIIDIAKYMIAIAKIDVLTLQE